MNIWLIILNCNSASPEIIMETTDFQEAIDACNLLVKTYDKDYSVWLKDEWEEE
jgi:hypothetical protein